MASRDEGRVEEITVDVHQEQTGGIPREGEATVRSRRRQLKGKLTRAINRFKEHLRTGEQEPRRLKRMLQEIRTDYSRVSDINAELYDYVQESEIPRLNQWECDLEKDMHDIEDMLEDYLSGGQQSRRELHPGVLTRSAVKGQPVRSDNGENLEIENEPVQTQSGENVNKAQHINSLVLDSSRREFKQDFSQEENFDSWIDNLTEFRETVLPVNMSEMSISEVLYKLEASKEIPTITLDKFNGDPLRYVDFIEKFKIYIHDKPQLCDDMRMVQLQMHLIGDAQRAISGLGCSGRVYATALKLLKDQFGQRSLIARECLKLLASGERIGSKDRDGLRDFSLDIVNCLSILQRIDHHADANSSEILRNIIRRLPDHMIVSWKSVASDIRVSGSVPKLSHVSEFVRKRVRADFDPDFGDIEIGPRGIGGKTDNRSKFDRKRGVHSAQVTQKVLKCYVCEEGHRVSACPIFVNYSVLQRLQCVKDHKLCFSCLNRGHIVAECRSKKRCNVNGCNRSHNSLLHSDPPPSSGITSVLDRDGIMPVVRVRFRSVNGKELEGNVLIDSGAGTTVIRRGFAKSLGLQGKRDRLDISVVGGNTIEQPYSRRLKFWVSPLDGGEEYCIEAHDIEKTILSVPPLNRPWLKSHRHLADLQFPHKAGPVDLILGVQYCHLHVEEEVREGLPFEPVAKKTRLGWYVIGADTSSAARSVCSIGFMQRLDLEKFYEFETLGIQAPECTCSAKGISTDGKRALEMFEASCRREDSRFMIGLPWKADPSVLPDNYQQAERRLVTLERSLLKNEQKAHMYDGAIHEYVDNGWAVPVSQEERKLNINPVYYLPHHGVYRPDKASTPLRVVFDPACPFKGVSLNSLLYKGPGLIGNLFGVLLRFREQEIAIMGDISKMYLQILLPESDTHVHRFLWRNLDSSKEPDVYRLTRVTFGDKPSPDMASFVLLRMADESSSEFPHAAIILQRDRYMDDLIHSCQTQEEAIARIKELDCILSSGSFQVKKWICSFKVETELSGERGMDCNRSVGLEKRETQGCEGDILKQSEVRLDGEEDVKALGVVWNADCDVIKFQVKDRICDNEILTKRIILSYISGIYDPLGLASVVLIRARIALQNIWRCKQFNWDDRLPPDITEVWSELFRDIYDLTKVQFPRSLKPADVVGPCELHVFADASALAYGAVVYCLWPTVQGKRVRLVTSKARVAPLRQTTIPRLELMAALVASRLAKTVYDQLKVKPVEVTLWTDSQIVLHWLKSDSAALKPFVGIRVSEIQSTWQVSNWRYVPSKLNPADDLSRGLKVEALEGRWMNGPSFLTKPKEQWPALEVCTPAENLEFKSPRTIYALSKSVPFLKAEDFSEWDRLVRVTAYCFRFVRNLKMSDRTGQKRIIGPLQAEEIKIAEHYWFRMAQVGMYDWDSRYRDLSPFLQDEILRVGGRLRRTQLTYDQIHPVLLPASHTISTLLMRDVHIKLGHVGPERTLCESRRKVWVIRGRNLARKIVQFCVVCRKLKQPVHTTLMADLPPERLQPFTPPFSVTGVDLFGPFLLKYGRNSCSKAWGSLFTCASVRAIHLEIVDGLSTHAFLHAFRRFVSRRGWPKTVISDNGSSFIGASKELRKLFQQERSQIEDFAVSHKLNWKFTTPLSPHQGGMYESLIKQTKRAICVSIGNQRLSWNEMATVFAEVECLVNSRPIGHMPNAPNDLQPLTPNHFMIGRATSEVPQTPVRETHNLRKRFEFVQTLVHQFWRRFIREYVPTLIKRSKWQTRARQVKVGDIVLLSDPISPRGKWNLARVIEVYPGVDDIVRNVKVRTRTGEYKRSVQRCCLILENSE